MQVEGKPSEVVQLVLAPGVGQLVPWTLLHRGVAKAGRMAPVQDVAPTIASRAVSLKSLFIDFLLGERHRKRVLLPG